jgi:hypothetical protein
MSKERFITKVKNKHSKRMFCPSGFTASLEDYSMKEDNKCCILNKVAKNLTSKELYAPINICIVELDNEIIQHLQKFKNIKALYIDEYMADNVIEELFCKIDLSKMVILDLNHLSNNMIHNMNQKKQIFSLKHMTVNSIDISNDTNIMFNSEYIKNLEHLKINYPNKRIANILFSSKSLQNMKYLSLNFFQQNKSIENPINDDTLIIIAKSRVFRNLESLSLEYNNITDKGLNELTNSANMPNLQYLDIGNNKISGNAVRNLIINNKHKYLRTLIINNCNVGYTQATYIDHKSRIAISSIENIVLDENGITDISIKRLFNNIKFINMREISLDVNNVTDKGMLFLMNLLKRKTLTTLTISANKISYKGLMMLTKMPNLEHLTYLDISCNTIDDDEEKEFITYIHKNALLNNLKEIKNSCPHEILFY